MKNSATKVTTLAHALQAAFEAWTADAPPRTKIEERTRMQLLRELSALPIRLEAVVTSWRPADGGPTLQQ